MEVAMTRIITSVALAVVVAFTGLAASAQATSVTLESNLEGRNDVQINICEDGWFLFAQKFNSGWSQAYAGLSCSPAPWCQVGFGAGTESAEHGLRLGGWLWLGYDRFSLLHLQEGASGGPWHRTLLTGRVDDRLSAGLIDRAYYGSGAVAEYKLGTSSKATLEWYEGGATAIAITHSF